MPVKTVRITSGKNQGKYRVSHDGVSAKATTKKKAKRQANLLRGVAHGWHPTGKKARK